MVFTLVIVLLFVALYVGLVQFYSWGWLLTPQLTYPSTAFVPKTRVTVLVPARNEAQQLQGLVEHLLQQAYPAALLEFIIINDHSTDDTLAQANTLAHTCPNPQGFSIRVLTLPGQLQGKKAALAHGVAHATGSLIITTDADCQMGPHWVAALVQYYQEHTHRVILGPVAMCPPHAPLQSRVLYHFQSLDLMGLMFITAGSLRFKFPHMANGANFAFEKQLFELLQGYQGIDHTPTGDDILFLLKAHSHYPGCAGFVKAPNAIVTTGAVATWAEFWQQRLRWASKSTGFNDARLTAILTFYYLYNLALVAFAVWAVFKPIMLLLFVLLLLGKWLPELVMMAHAAAFFGKPRQLLWFLPAQITHIFYVLRIGVESQVKTYGWKGRGYPVKR